MEKTKPLNSMYRRFSLGKIQRKEFEATIFIHIKTNSYLYKLHVWDEDRRMDYLCWLYPRIQKAIDAYREIGASFDAYIWTLVRGSSREFIERETKRNNFEQSYWEAKAEESVYSQEKSLLDMQGSNPVIHNKRQILILALKCYSYLSEDAVQRTAKALDINIDVLHKHILSLRCKRLARDEYMHKLLDRIGLQYYRCLSMEKRIHAMPENSLFREELEGDLCKARERLDSMRRRYKGLRRLASNREIAEVLGLSKGTVDSSMHTLKWNWAKYQG